MSSAFPTASGPTSGSQARTPQGGHPPPWVHSTRRDPALSQAFLRSHVAAHVIVSPCWPSGDTSMKEAGPGPCGRGQAKVSHRTLRCGAVTPQPPHELIYTLGACVSWAYCASDPVLGAGDTTAEGLLFPTASSRVGQARCVLLIPAPRGQLCPPPVSWPFLSVS